MPRLKKLLIVMIVILGTLNIEKPASAKQDLVINVNLWDNSLLVINKGQVIKMFKIASGRKKNPTPIGHYTVINKSKDWGGGFGTHWLELNVPWGMYGIHGTNRPYLIGQHVSHGCVRMRNQDVAWLYDHTPVGTPVDIIGPVAGLEDSLVLAVGARGTLVYLLQQRLKLAGDYTGKVNGIFNKKTEQAIKKYQKRHHLTITGHGNQRLYLELGLLE